MKKTRKKLGGMTLVECLIALLVFALLSLLLLTLGTSINKHSRSARELNKKVAYEGPVAEAQNTSIAVSPGDINIKVKYNKTGGQQTITIPATAYEVYQSPSDIEYDTDGNVISDPANRNFKFVNVPKPTNPPATTAAATTEATS